LILGAMNPCPCGFFPDRSRCNCTPVQIQNYLNRLSRPILERFDICVEAAPVTFAELEDQTTENEDSAVIRSRVEKAVKIQATRFQGTDIRNNSCMGQKEIQRFCKLKEPEKRFARRVYEARGISARGYHRVLKTARTIADLAGEEWIQKEHLSEAFGYRALEERIWGQKH
ncbi:MAG: ATP-binding protein, partial [Enterocloster sp.]|nr:ATP-binding protein [Enterocloster sp.]